MSAVGFYVSVRDGSRSGLLYGPCDTHDEALGKVDEVQAAAALIDPDAHWYAFGTAKVTATPGRALPAGRLGGPA
jgi:hypothetical protein